MSLGIYFSSHGILKTSDGILFPTDEIGENSEKFGERSEKIKKKSEKTEEYSLILKFENGKEENFHRLLPSFFSRRRKNLDILGLGF